MLSERGREKLILEVLRTAAELISVEDLGKQILPRLERAYETSGSLIYRVDNQGMPRPLFGHFVDVAPLYYKEYAAVDPLQKDSETVRSAVGRASRLPSWKAYLDHPVFTEYCHKIGMDYFMYVKIFGDKHMSKRAVAMLLTRTLKQPDFEDQDEEVFARLLPGLEAVVRRSDRLQELMGIQTVLNGVVQTDPRPMVALNHRGGHLWSSAKAQKIMGWTRNNKSLPENLVIAAKKLGTLFEKDPPLAQPTTTATFLGKRGVQIRADLRLAGAGGGTTFILASLEDPLDPVKLKDIKAQFGLTAGEVQVLDLIAKGLSNRDIGAKLFVSEYTVHTHVSRILGKMGVRSRVQAALLAHGLS